MRVRWCQKMGDSAFPLNIPNPSEYYSEFGLTKREYFSGLAMQGILANPKCSDYGDIIVEDSIKFADLLMEKLDA